MKKPKNKTRMKKREILLRKCGERLDRENGRLLERSKRLQSMPIRKSETVNEWIDTWKKELTLEERISRLNYAFDLVRPAVNNPEYIMLVNFFLILADGYLDIIPTGRYHTCFVPEEIEYQKRHISLVAFKILCDRFFYNNQNLSVYDKINFSETLFPIILWFFRPKDNQGFRSNIDPRVGVEIDGYLKEDELGKVREFATKFALDTWDIENRFRHHGLIQNERKIIKRRIMKRWPEVLDLLARLGLVKDLFMSEQSRPSPKMVLRIEKFILNPKIIYPNATQYKNLIFLMEEDPFGKYWDLAQAINNLKDIYDLRKQY